MSEVSPFLYSGQQAVTASAAALPSQLLGNGLRIRNMSTSGASIFVGASAVTITTGHELRVGDEIELAVRNASAVYVIAAATGSRVSFVGN